MTHTLLTFYPIIPALHVGILVAWRTIKSEVNKKHIKLYQINIAYNMKKGSIYI